ncbi:uncharacterized protein IUM83_01361 [Phytophthora cinnamomi]|uniref:uncharacterized protein n=1 Tax=Phytophthora cinnamomi TaxID=4785 RepID=UPI00355AC475|nr:hypothetical protein IUM83_01361 [Phytophthora cinnamomi]
MSMNTYHRLLLDPYSSWSKKAKGTSMPIPVPLESNENMGDYQQKFEFWLAQRNVTLASLREDVIRERNYRCGYAQWRVQMGFGHTAPASIYGPQRARSRSPVRVRQEQESERYLSTRPRSPVRCGGYQGVTQRSVSTPRPSRFYDARRARRYDDEKTGASHGSCKTCGRDWADFNRRLTQLENIISRLDLPTANTFGGHSSSPYEISGDAEQPRDDSSRTSNFIDLTDDFEDEVEAAENVRSVMGDNSNGSATPVTGESRSVEITPTDSDTNHEGPSTAGDLDEPTSEPVHEFESKMPPGLGLLIDTYNQINDQVLSEQKEEKKVVTAMKSMTDGEEACGAELQSRVCKLSELIKLEKEKRDAAVAAVIVCGLGDKKAEFARDVESMGTSDAANEQEDFHEKCAGIAAKLVEKEKELARLQKQLQSVSSLDESDSALMQRESQDLSSKIALERASKTSLETERQKIFTRLMKSSRNIQALVAKELSSEA